MAVFGRVAFGVENDQRSKYVVTINGAELIRDADAERVTYLLNQALTIIYADIADDDEFLARDTRRPNSDDVASGWGVLVGDTMVCAYKGK